MKFIKITLSSGSPITLPFDKAAALFASDQQLVMISDEKGQWTGRVINKAFIVSAERDLPEERTWRIANPVPALPEPEEPTTPEGLKRTEEKKEAIRQQLGISKPYPDDTLDDA